MENENQGQPDKFKKQNPSRRKRVQDRRRANFGAGPGGIDRRKNPGDRRRFLGDRRSKFKPPVDEKPIVYELNVDPDDDWDKKIRELESEEPDA